MGSVVGKAVVIGDSDDNPIGGAGTATTGMSVVAALLGLLLACGFLLASAPAPGAPTKHLAYLRTGDVDVADLGATYRYASARCSQATV